MMKIGRLYPELLETPSTIASVVSSGTDADTLADTRGGTIIEYTVPATRRVRIDIDGVEYDFLASHGGYYGEPGSPMLPTSGQFIAVPPGCSIDGVDVVELDIDQVSGKYNIFPIPTENTEDEDDEYCINDGIYQTPQYYPEDWWRILSTRDHGYMQVIHLMFYDYKYNPASKHTLKLNSIKLRVVYNVDGDVDAHPRPIPRTLPREMYLDIDNI